MFEHEWKIEKIFVFLVIPLGILYSLFIPISRVPDEREHFLKAYQITKGNLYAVLFEDKSGGGYLPSNIEGPIHYQNNYKDTIKNINVQENDEIIPVKYTQMAVYSFIIHCPQSIGVLLGNILNSSILVKAYLGRITNFIFYIKLQRLNLF